MDYNYTKLVNNVNHRINHLATVFTRKKKIVNDESATSGLSRCLSTLDLTILGIGSTLGVGVYVVAGNVAYHTSGPAVVISFAIAAIVSMIAGLCYAEFGGRVPKAGSVYAYSYVTMGELVAFIIGWTLILEYVIGVASVVRALSSYVDAMLHNSMMEAFQSAMTIQIGTRSYHPDFFAFGATIFFSVAIAFGAKESSLVNNLFSLVNVCVLLFVIILGSVYVNTDNWKLSPRNVTSGSDGSGGFAPYGITGIMVGAAKCFYAFIGFDCIATASEEAQNPKKTIPIAIVASLTFVFLAYFGVSVVLTLVIPYYNINPNTPIPDMFHSVHINWAQWVVSVGAISAMCASILGAMFPLPRVIYAMACDGLIFKWLGNIHTRFQTPLAGTLAAGALTAFLAAIFDLTELMDMMSIGTLLAYTIVAMSVLILRYKETETFEKKDDRDPRTVTLIIKQLMNVNRLKRSTKLTSQIVTTLVVTYSVICVWITFFLENFMNHLQNIEIWAISLMFIAVTILAMTLCFIYCQPMSDEKLVFAVPLVPFLPAISIFINFYLMMQLGYMIWLRFIIWLALGFSIYFFYGIYHSLECKKKPVDSNSMNDDAQEITSF